MHVVVTVTLKNGERHSKRVDKLSGWIGQPLTREQRLRKFHSCARRVLDAQAADRVVELVDRLDQLESVTAIVDIVRGKRNE